MYVYNFILFFQSWKRIDMLLVSFHDIGNLDYTK